MGDERTASLPVIDPGDGEPADLDPKNSDASDAADVDASETVDGTTKREGPVAGVLLAAGTGSRFEGGNKLLVPLEGEPLVRRAARTLDDGHFEPLVAVVGHEADRVRDALDGIGFRIVVNPDFERGQATSVRAGVESLDDVTAALFALGDMPFVDQASILALVTTYRAGRRSALAAACDGRRGNPVLFDRRHFDALADVSGDVGGRRILLESGDAALVETGDPGVLRDVDTREDLPRDGGE